MRLARIALSRSDNSPYFRWAQKGTLAIVDQGLFAGSNFVLSVLLARWMSEADYGAYSIIYSVFLLIAGFQNVLLLEPMSVFGPIRHLQHVMEYLNQLIRLHFQGAAFTSAGLLLVAGAIYAYRPESALIGAFLGLGLGHAFTLFFWLVRRACYLKFQTGQALIGTGLYWLVLAVGFACVKVATRVTSLSALMVVGCAGLVAGLALYRMLLRQSSPASQHSEFTHRAVAVESWQYGQWMLVASVSSWLSYMAYFSLVGSFLSLEEAAGLKAIQNIIMPFTQVVNALMLLFMPWASQQFARHGMAALKSATRTFVIGLTAMSLMYLGIIWVFDDVVLKLLYGNRFAQFGWMVPFLLVQPLIMAMTSGWLCSLRIVERTWDVMMSSVIGGITTLTVGIALIHFYGMEGVVAGILASSLAPLPFLIMAWNKATRRARSRPCVNDIKPKENLV